MSLKKNTIANYIGQIYISLIGIVIFPFYLQYLGASAFGLVGFFSVFQAWLRLLDMGLTPALSRQIASVRGGTRDYFSLRQLVRSLEVVFIAIAMVVFTCVYMTSDWIASSWLNVQEMHTSTVADCVTLMGVMFAARWMTDFYGSGLVGLEKQVIYNVINMICISLQYIGGWLFLHFVSNKVNAFFEYQTIIILINLFLMLFFFYAKLPSSKIVGFYISMTQLKSIMPFALGLSYSSIVWTLVTQSDKLVFSHILPLSQYGYYALIVLIATGVLQIASPITQAILPRMTYLLMKGENEKMLDLYCKSVIYMCVIMFSVAGCIAIFAMPLLYAWSGSLEAAHWGEKALFWYVLASGILSISAFQYYLQFAHGSLKLHVWYNTIAAIMKVPLIIYVAYSYGVYFTAITWFVLNLSILIVWTPIVHHIYARGISYRWFKNVLLVFILSFILIFIINELHISFSLGRVMSFIQMIVVGFAVLVLLALFTQLLLKLKKIG